jgi:hypothetical protein
MYRHKTKDKTHHFDFALRATVFSNSLKLVFPLKMGSLYYSTGLICASKMVSCPTHLRVTDPDGDLTLLCVLSLERAFFSTVADFTDPHTLDDKLPAMSVTALRSASLSTIIFVSSKRL